jgi:hypothetical protein
MDFIDLFLLICSVFININLYRKYNDLEKNYDELDEISTENQEFILSIRNKVLSQQSYLRQLDRNGSFESDDEVGYFFKELKTIINNIASYVDVKQEQDDEVLDDSNTFLGSLRSTPGE